jgi:beta-galactosidase beta subunit
MQDLQGFSSSNQAKNAEYDQISCDDVIQQSRKKKNQDARDKRNHWLRRYIDLHILISLGF